MQPRLVVIPLFDGVQSLDVTGPLEVFAGAAEYVHEHAPTADPAYRVVTASLYGHPVQTSSGLRLLPTTELRDIPPPGIDTVVVPGGPGGRCPNPELAAWLRYCAPLVRRVASVCTGAYVLAEAGLLTGRRVTTH